MKTKVYNPTNETCTYCEQSVEHGELILTSRDNRKIHICADCLIKAFELMLQPPDIVELAKHQHWHINAQEELLRMNPSDKEQQKYVENARKILAILTRKHWVPQ